MHQTAYKNAQLFYDKYCHENIQDKIVLDIGSYDVNGTMKPIFSKAKQYIGLDQESGPNVDIVSSSHNIKLADNSIDIIISSSCFEHDPMFWITFKEMCRLLTHNGYLYICAPSSGPYHAHPIDNWRFYKDSWSSLRSWAEYLGYNLQLVDSYIDTEDKMWQDSVGIYVKK
jgi:SAM-dependent methyltransferase